MYCSYLDGSGIATRLSRRITTVTKEMKLLLTNYNKGLPPESEMQT